MSPTMKFRAVLAFLILPLLNLTCLANPMHHYTPESLASAVTTTNLTRDISPRDNYGALYCDVQPWFGNADGYRLLQGENYLDGILWPRTCNVGPRSCVRVSCSYNSGIYLCNDNYFEIFPTCPSIADMAKFIVQWCPAHPYGSGMGWNGQVFGEGGMFNVIVHGDNC